MRTGVETAAKLAQAVPMVRGFRAPQAWMLTLTYAQPDAWQARHVSSCVEALRVWSKRKGYLCSGVWVAEMQERRYITRGERAIHYHLVVWLPRGVTPPKPDKQGWWAHGMSQRIKARSPVGYLMKYASKGSKSPLPKGARIHGCFGLAELRAQYTWHRRAAWLRQLVRIGDRLRRADGGGWIHLSTGELLRSPWVVHYAAGVLTLRLRSVAGALP